MKVLTPNIKPQWNVIIVDILREFIKICEENHLTYFCAGGTVLGAVRHQGIIPWDDDIDVNMPRPDYDQFLKICEKRDMGDYEVVSPSNNKDYPLLFSKLCNRKTTLIEETDVPCVIGLYIDIFPLDGTADDIDEAFYIMKRFQKIKNRIAAISTHVTFWNYMKYLLQPHEWGRFVYKTIGFLCRKSYRSYLLKKLDAISYKYNYNDAKNVILYSGGYARRDIYPKKWFDDQTMLPFEGIDIKVPAHYDEYLHQLYDDYMQLPPIEERGLRHPKAYFNLERRERLEDIT